MRLIIRCPKCKGPCWEEQLPDSNKYIDLVCICCGLRRFYPRKRYMDLKKRIENGYMSESRRVLPTLR